MSDQHKPRKEDAATPTGELERKDFERAVMIAEDDHKHERPKPTGKWMAQGPWLISPDGVNYSSGEAPSIASKINAALAVERENVTIHYCPSASDDKAEIQQLRDQLAAEREERAIIYRSRDAWKAQVVGLAKVLAVEREQLAAEREQLAAAQSANKLKTESLIHLIDALKSSGFIMRQQDLDARTVTDTTALDAAISAATKPLVYALRSYQYDENGHIVTWLSEAAHRDALAKAQSYPLPDGSD